MYNIYVFFFSESILEISYSKYHWGCPKSLSIPCPVNVSSDGSNPLHVAVSICRPHMKRLVFLESLGITVCKEALTPYQHASVYTPLSGCLKKRGKYYRGKCARFFSFCDVDVWCDGRIVTIFLAHINIFLSFLLGDAWIQQEISNRCYQDYTSILSASNSVHLLFSAFFE